MNVIDRRQNSRDKNLNNRQRFLERTREQVKRAVSDALKGGNVKETYDQGKIKVPVKGTREPVFNHDHKSGNRQHVVPGNKEFIEGDTIPKPDEESGSGRSGAHDGDSEDEFEFTLTKEEFLNFFFEDLELPDLIKKQIKDIDKLKSMRSGFTNYGSPVQLDVRMTMRYAIGRRIALHRPKPEDIDELEAQAAALTEAGDLIGALKLYETIKMLANRMKAVPWIDPFDVRYRNFVMQPQPVTQAVMVCVDGDTEYLAEEGWRSIRDYKSGKIAQYTANGDLEFVEPLAFVKNDYSDEFVHIRTQGIDQMLTPQHRVIYRTQTGVLKELTAAELENRHNATTHGFRGKIITHFSYDGPGLPLTDDEVRLHVAYKADGTYQQKNTNRAQFVFHKERKVTRLIQLLERMGIAYNRTEHGPRTNIYFTTTKRIAKGFGQEWYSASAHQLAIISEEVLHWDGYGKRQTFTRSKKRDVDYVQFVWASSGYGTNVYPGTKKTWVVTRCSYRERGFSSKEPHKIVRTTIEDKHSYCFNVPSGMLVLRRNENIFVTGNCIMDVSGSMAEREKDIAKRFFMLLYIFLTRKYQNVDIVYVRHHSSAEECNEQDFFYKRESGGTLVSSGLELANKIIRDRYPVNDWNIYVAQASDGDNYAGDNADCRVVMARMLPIVQYFAYLDIPAEVAALFSSTVRNSDLWNLYFEIAKLYPNLAMKHASDQSQIWGVFAELFAKDRQPAHS